MMVEKQSEGLEAVIFSEKQNLEHYEESVLELKQIKTKVKSAFTKVRHHLLVSFQQEVNIGHINKPCNELDGVEQDAMDSMIKLSERYNSQNDSKSCVKVSKEMEQMEIEYTSAQNRSQKLMIKNIKSSLPARRQRLWKP